jgi:hypothetical protein
LLEFIIFCGHELHTHTQRKQQENFIFLVDFKI